MDAEVKERRRHASFRRILLTLEMLREFRYGCSIEFVRHAVQERTGDRWNLRTTRRDLYFLREMGLADFIVEPGGVRHTWKAVPKFNRQL